MKRLLLRAAGCSVALLLALYPLAKADATVTFTTLNLGGGQFQYDFTIDNTSGTIPIAGLLIEGGQQRFRSRPEQYHRSAGGMGFPFTSPALRRSTLLLFTDAPRRYPRWRRAQRLHLRQFHRSRHFIGCQRSAGRRRHLADPVFHSRARHGLSACDYPYWHRDKE